MNTNTMFEFRAFWPKRPEMGICSIKNIDYEHNNANITNGQEQNFPSLDDLELMLRTSYQDNEGTPVFQDDVLLVDNVMYVVTYGHDTNCFYLHNLDSRKIRAIPSRSDSVQCKVLGNIWQVDKIDPQYQYRVFEETGYRAAIEETAEVTP